MEGTRDARGRVKVHSLQVTVFTGLHALKNIYTTCSARLWDFWPHTSCAQLVLKPQGETATQSARTTQHRPQLLRHIVKSLPRVSSYVF